ncbi:MAG: tetratricopeptide repeat protein [Bacteroidales bacterium]
MFQNSKFSLGLCCIVTLLLSFTTIAQKDPLCIAYAKSTKSTEKITILRQIVEKYKNLQSDTAYVYCKKAQNLANELDNKRLFNEFSLKEGELERFMGNYLKAMDWVETSIKKSKEYKDRAMLAKGYLILGKIQLDLSIMDLSYTSATQALTLFKELKDPRGEREAINLLGCVLLTENKSEESIPYFLQAHRIDSIHQYNDFLSADYLNLGVAYMQLSQTNKAKEYYQKALSISRQYNYVFQTISGLLNLTGIYLATENYQAGLDCSLEALELSKNYAHKKRWVQSTYSVGELYWKIGNGAKAIEYLTQTEQLSNTFGYIELAKLSTLLLSDYYYAQNQYQKAYQYKALSSQYSDSLSKKQNIDNLNRLRYETQYQQAEKEREWQNKIRNLVFGFIICILLLIIILFVFYFNRQKLKVKNAELEKQNLSNKLEHKSKEVITKIMFLRKKNEAISTIAQNLLDSKHLFKEENQPVITNVVHELRNACKDESWKEFELRFEEVHTDFFKKLNDRFPDLTQNDKRLCAYLRLNISTKDIASLLYLSVAGVESARYRLRKKLNINSTDVDIVQFLENL